MNKTFNQFFKFLIVGFNNTSIDFLILNLLMYSFNTYRGWSILIFNIISFTIAVSNSYLINRFWTFKTGGDKKIYRSQILLILLIILILVDLKFLKNNILFVVLAALFLIFVLLINHYVIKNFLLKEKISESSLEFGKFVFLSAIGVFINSTIFYSLTSFVSPLFNLSKVLWANFSKAIATCLTLLWNFLCYKFIVFKKINAILIY